MAEEQMVPTWAQVGLAFAGSVLLAASLVYSAHATRYAAAAADAANKTLGAERAWITWDQPTIGEVVRSVVEGVSYENSFAFTAGWKNTGRSPALNLSTYNAVRVIETGDPRVDDFEIGNDALRTVENNVGVGMPVSGKFIAITDIPGAGLAAAIWPRRALRRGHGASSAGRAPGPAP